MRWAVVLVACSSAAPRPVANKTEAVVPPPASLVDQIVRAELEHAVTDPAWLPDAKLLDAPILVQREVEVGHMAGDAFTSEVQAITALPAGGYALVDKAALPQPIDAATRSRSSRSTSRSSPVSPTSTSGSRCGSRCRRRSTVRSCAAAVRPICSATTPATGP